MQLLCVCVCGYRYIIVIMIINTFAAASAEISRAKNRPGGVSFYGRGDGCGIAGPIATIYII